MTDAGWPELALPVTPPLEPMEARLARALPTGRLLFEPKWDGFRCLAFKDGDAVALQSKAGQPLGRYFPELVDAFRALDAKRFVLDGEIVIPSGSDFSFDALLQRIHPAESRILTLARATPAMFLAFDLLVDERARLLRDEPFSHRRQRLEAFAKAHFDDTIRLSPATTDRDHAEGWLHHRAGEGTDGVMAKRLDAPYRAGERDRMVKVKRARSADCVVGGFRWSQDGREIGSLLLGLYDDEGRLNHVGHCSAFPAEVRKQAESLVKPLVGGEGFTGRTPGGPSRWARGRDTSWVAIEPSLVVEVGWDHFTGGRFRHGTTFVRWRPDKAPRQCTEAQLGFTRSAAGLGAGHASHP